MSIRTSDPTCQVCGRPLRDQASRYRLVGSDCWSRMTAAQQAAALEHARTSRDPFAIPATRPASLQARLNNINARRATQPGEGQLCHHENVVGRCADCRREADPHRASERILGDILRQPHADRRAERIQVQDARRNHMPLHEPQRPVQPQTPRDTTPVPAPHPPSRHKPTQRHTETNQLELT